VNGIFRQLALAALLLVPLAGAAESAGQGASPEVTVVRIQGPIGQTQQDYIQRGILAADEAGSELLIIKLDTPGGLLNVTQKIVQDILASPVPVAVYVYPRGASAGSAGLFITLSAHVAAMAPATNIGAASPVQMGSGAALTPPPNRPNGEEEDSGDVEENDGERQMTTQERKMFEYAESYVEAIARLRDRNVEWAKAAVRDAAAIPADEALEKRVIDLIAEDLRDLLEKVDSWEIEDRVLNTAAAKITRIEMTPGERFLKFLFNPQIMFILMLVAIYGIIGELSNPGAIFPGTAGVIALVLLLYAVAAVPVNIAGFLLIAFAIALMLAELFTPSFGLLTVGGAISFALGSLMLFDDLGPAFALSWYYIVPAAILTALFFSFVVSSGLRAQLTGVKMGSETLRGRRVKAVRDVGPDGGKVYFDGEYWNAVSRTEIPAGSFCRILGNRGLTLDVEPLGDQSENGGDRS